MNKKVIIRILLSVVYFTAVFAIFALVVERDKLAYYVRMGAVCGLIYQILTILIQKYTKKKK